MAASTTRAFLVYPATYLSLRPYYHHHQQQFLQWLQSPPQPPLPCSADLHLLIRPWLPSILPGKRSGFSSTSLSAVSYLISGVDGGGVSYDFISTRKSGFICEFSVIANMLKRIELLDASVISKDVSDSAKDSMKQTISAMLGLLPSDQFFVTVWFPKRPLDRLIVSSIITGYTLRNAEYRISLMRNFDITLDISKDYQHLEENGVLKLKGKQSEGAEGGLSGVEARLLHYVHCHTDNDCQFICLPHTHLHRYNCAQMLCQCDIAEEFAAELKTGYGTNGTRLPLGGQVERLSRRS